jgi:titin
MVTTTADSGPGSLRQAILDANGHTGPDAIDFAIGSGVRSIAPLSPLPALTDRVIIDATTQPGYAGTPIIQLDGFRAGPQADGLSILAPFSRVQGLVINRFKGNGIVVADVDDVVSGNYVGADLSGTIGLGNGGDGILVTGVGAIVGGATSDARNIISANGKAGIRVRGASAVGNTLVGNWIGLTAEGNGPLGNQENGVVVDGAGSTEVGLPEFGPVNLISGNRGDGVVLRGASFASSTVAGNWIGTDATGTVALGNQGAGVVVDGTSAFVGGSQAGDSNVISGNLGPGIRIATLDSFAQVTSVSNNRIGTDVNGALALGNQGPGILVTSGRASVGGPGALGGNVISGNLGDGIDLGPSAARDCIVSNNRIGTNADGTACLGNAGAGVVVNGPEAILGGTLPGSGNVISGNAGDGVRLLEGSDGSSLTGNLIGLNAAGDGALGNAGSGVLATASNVMIGLTVAGEGNTISGNGGDGVTLLGTHKVRVWNNFIGTDVTGTGCLGNGGNGVLLGRGASDNTVGGAFLGGGNLIAFNGGTGVVVGLADTDLAVGNAIRGNAIFGNGGLGIDLGNDGVTPNHDAGQQMGPDHWQNYPVLTAAQAGTVTHVTGTLEGLPNASYLLDFYASAAADPTGYGQGQTLLGWAVVLTDAQGHAAFDLSIAVTSTAGDVLTATANNFATSDTSEFSQAVPLTEPPAGRQVAEAGKVPPGQVDGWAVDWAAVLGEVEARCPEDLFSALWGSGSGFGVGSGSKAATTKLGKRR